MKNITEHFQEYRVFIMKWLAQSSNLDSIENLWHDLKHYFYLKFQVLFFSLFIF